MPRLLDEAAGWLPGSFRELILGLLDYLRSLDQRVKTLERQIQLWHRDNALNQKLEEIPGIGPLTASALVASIGDAKQFSTGR